ncbi:23S rRNA (uracil(1939)-C(5))-methyltransferase RlmD [Clostridium sp. AF37-5]|uniref:23S rRNA (uracil(1939)-C(5))-methyltransferase RlmD n=1 Tax=Clostridium sp. AF37-5 TaxID=2293016 RepID=UPI000E52A0AE|nr:23S rRNA (uracil(1939)-C(5))-methyltransferase RlmD [Clostridium sp. AF37-5]RHO98916.1 23S rRNA (uracil(1939)-C(5))-methyltransferase RlmD [Clostridium sp. AF37-5]
MKKNEFYEGMVTSLKFPNKGIVYVEDEDAYVQVKNTLPGQRVRFQLKKVKKKRPEGNLTEVLVPSEIEKAVPPCPHFSECGGCAYQTLPYEEQKKLKLNQVKALLDAVYPDFPLDECVESPRIWEYRNKMEFSFGDEVKDGPLTLGLHKRGSFYDIVSVPDCQIIDEDLRKVLKTTQDFFRNAKLGGKSIDFYHKMRHEGVLRHLLVRKGLKTGEMLICLVTSSQGGIDSTEGKQLLEKYKDTLLALETTGTFAGILHMTNDSLSDVVKADAVDILYGKDYFYDELLGLRFRITPFSFFQTNSAGAEKLYSLAREYIGDLTGKKVYDLYSGTGTIAQVLAPVAKEVTGVEIVEEAVYAAAENAKENQLDNCTFLAGDVLTVLDELTEAPDAIVLDPPREGIHPKAIRKILDYGLSSFVYISCKPTSLARDLEVFLEYGYQPVRAKCVDMFPWTRGIETVVLLSQLRQKPDDYIDVDIDVAELEGTSAETKATYEKIKKYVAEHNDGMKVSNLYIAQVKRKCGIELAENFNLPKSEDARQPRCPKEKEEAIVEALKAFQMI